MGRMTLVSTHCLFVKTCSSICMDLRQLLLAADHHLLIECPALGWCGLMNLGEKKSSRRASERSGPVI